MVIVVPPKQVFETPPSSVSERLSNTGYSIPSFEKLDRSKRGEMLCYYTGHPVPRKGMPYVEAISTNNQVKRMTLTLFLPFLDLRRGFKAFLQSYLHNYNRLADSIYTSVDRIPYLHKEYYTSTGKGIWDLTSYFFQDLGVSYETAEHTGKIMATILEYDDAYRMPLVDIMSEFTKEEIVKSPIGFAKKFLRLFCERSDNNDPQYGLVGKVKKIFFFIQLILLIPRFRRAFRKAFSQVDLSLLQYDEYDYYWSLNRKGFDAHGRTITDRLGEMRERVKQHLDEKNAIRTTQQQS